MFFNNRLLCFTGHHSHKVGLHHLLNWKDHHVEATRLSNFWSYVNGISIYELFRIKLPNFDLCSFGFLDNCTCCTSLVEECEISSWKL